MLGAFARRLFGSANDRLVKSMRKTVDQINALESSIAALDDSELRAKTDEFKRRLAAGETLDDLHGRGVRGGARGGQADAQAAPFRRAADRRHGAAQGRHRRDEDRRRQDAGGDARHLPERPRRQGRARRHGQRLPGPPRRRLDGRGLRPPGHGGRRDRPWAGRRPAQAGLCLRHHLRHQQRVRLRLSARQHAPRPRCHGAAGPSLRHRRRGRFRSWSTRRARP